MLRFTIHLQRNKWVVFDESQMPLYTIKKKWRSGYIMTDRHDYTLYEFSTPSDDPHPVYQILLNGQQHAAVTCTSKFLEPRMEITCKDMTWVFRTDNRLDYTISTDNAICGNLKILPIGKGEYQYHLHLQPDFFEEFLFFVPLAAVECLEPILQKASNPVSAERKATKETRQQPAAVKTLALSQK